MISTKMRLATLCLVYIEAAKQQCVVLVHVTLFKMRLHTVLVISGIFCADELTLKKKSNNVLLEVYETTLNFIMLILIVALL